ncbi:glycerol-3-phosphate dehydrogenase/oxidase [Tenuifilum sp.]|uniref:glycerol-3-phosphate dehydrogenase/oxidase n=1 Tax=Tenuifilum sp. TaxID=2760880 RepID=UPI002B7CFD2E|nr:glycerol-3-phosphate dehydrogenase/oxidase [Tenuifilum sp.]HPP89669.1 glycerol-3-phosphate dehydrogenase/oxidase [Tenuifilum sp.]HRR12012.1 glycerol-3-phosphate dehydrogenase/oxidase [Tenuifilum sp.]HRS44488.1 glycerol-3-phosphate dehydrogenase/oxidase [Tenuifilum sp.]
MNREQMLSQAVSNDQGFDFVIIGGGATGIGIALEAATRGYRTLLLEKHDFTKSTSSKSTKLVHGGVRYLAQGDIALVREACIERGRLLKNAPHLVKNQSFVIPTFGWFDELMYTVGLTFYDLLAGSYSLGRSLRVSKKRALEYIPTIEPKKITAGVVYHDGQFDDSRLAINILQTATEHGAMVLNYMNVVKLTKNTNGIVDGVVAEDLETGRSYTFHGKAIINATGVFADDVLQMDIPGQAKTISPSQGVHVVLDKSFLPGNHAMMIPKTDDGRVLFAVPWHNRIVVGTTDTPIPNASLEPVALEEEIEFILNTAGRYLTKAPKRSDVLSVFAGLRPLAAPTGESKKTKEISRSHKIIVTQSELFTMVGGKWTTFRRMAEDMVNRVESVKGWEKSKTKTRNLKIHGYTNNVNHSDPLYVYGTDKEKILELARVEPELGETLSQSLGIIKAQVVWAVRNEMARNVEDFLARRTRCLLLDARESMRIAPAVAAIMARELNRDKNWEREQVENYLAIAQNYILS